MNNSTLLVDINGTDNGTSPRAIIFTPTIFLVYNTYLCISLILGITGNGLVLAVFAKFKASTSTDWFIIFITIFDFISSVINIPVYLTFTTGHWQTIGNHIFCKLHMFVSQSVALSSTFLVCGLAIERYLKICRRNACKISKAHALYICTAISCFATLLSVPCFEMYKNVYGQCTANPLLKGVFYYYLMVLFTYILAFIIVTFCYTKISIVVLKSERNVAKHNTGANEVTQSCCCAVFGKSSRNRVAPSSFVTHTSTSQPNDDEDKTKNAQVVKKDTMCRQEGTSNFLSVPQASKCTNISTVSITVESSISGHNDSTPSASARRRITSQNAQKPVSVPSRSHQGKKTTRITFAVCLIFILSWLPPWIAFSLFSVEELRTVPNILIFGLFGKMTYLLNTFMNPILYLCLNRKFRKQTAKLVCFWKSSTR